MDSTFEIANEIPVCSTVMRPTPSIRINGVEINKNGRRRTNRRLATIDLSECSSVEAPNNENPTESENSLENASQEKTVIAADRLHVRRSVRISSMQNIVNHKADKNMSTAPIRKQAIKNKILSGYLNNSASSMKSVTKKDHKKAIMDIINTGSMKELQLLPAIGPKTAYQIVSTRAVKGKFKSLDDVKKGLMMKDKTWDKFLEVSCLLFKLLIIQ